MGSAALQRVGKVHELGDNVGDDTEALRDVGSDGTGADVKDHEVLAAARELERPGSDGQLAVPVALERVRDAMPPGCAERLARNATLMSLE
jgi:hypothetical protein